MTWIVVAAVTVAILAGVFLAPTRDNDGWASVRKRAATLKDEANARNLSRPVLRGEPVPGDAWDEYNIALNDAKAFSEDGRGANLTKFHSRDAEADRAMVDRLLAAHKRALDHVRLGAQRTNGQYPYDWERGSQMDLPTMLGIRKVAMLGLAQARIWTEEGRVQDAANLLLDLSQFDTDVATNGPLLSNLIGISLYSMTLEAFERKDAVAQRFQLIDRLHFTAARKGIEEMRAEGATSDNPLVRQSEIQSPTKILTSNRETRARLRLLRAATAFLATGEIPKLADPFGGNLSYRQVGSKLKIWSLGGDGESQNGRGSWKSVLGEDFVLEISR
jgi:hypothetical protein